MAIERNALNALTMIKGRVDSGAGCASQIEKNKHRERRRAAEADLKRGTLNVRVDNLEAALGLLGEPSFQTDRFNKRLGPLRWWPVRVIIDRVDLPSGKKSFLVRHEKTNTDYLEVMSEIHFRGEGLEDGDRVHLLPIRDNI